MLAAGLETEHHRNHDSERGVAGEATRLAVTRVPVKAADETLEPLSHQPIQVPRGEASAGGSSKGADGLGAEDSEVPVGRGRSLCLCPGASALLAQSPHQTESGRS